MPLTHLTEHLDNPVINRIDYRAKLLRDQCLKKAPSIATDLVSRLCRPDGLVLPFQFLVAEELKLLYCTVPKAGSTNMRRILVHLKNHKNLKSFSFTSMNPADVWRAIRTRAVPFLLDKGDANARMIVKKYRKMLIVRHPLERLVSFYRMAFVKKSLETFKLGGAFNYFYYNRLKNIKTRNLTADVNKNVSFTDFIDFVISHHENVENGKWKISYSWDCHILPIARMCFPCLAKYDIIAKVETLDEDLDFIFQQFGISINITYPHKYKRTSASQSIPLMKTLSPHQLQRLKHIYRADMELFGYN